MSRARSFVRDLIAALWQQPLWAIPFALFFAVVYAPNWHGLLLSYKIALAYAYCIRLAMLATTWTLLPWLASRLPRRGPLGQPLLWIAGLVYMASSFIGAYAGVLIVRRFILPGFLGSGRAVLLTGLYTFVFTLLFTGISYAIVFYHEAVDRVRAEEQVRAELAQAELRALRARIQPHFLFNALNTIAALIGENPHAAEDTVTRLAEIFRYVLATSDQERAPLDTELRFVRDVLAIEQLRFGDRLRVVEEIEPGLESALVPSLLIQPLVENAVRHGIGARPQGGRIRLAARSELDRLTIEVEDDGPGFDPGTLRPDAGFGLRSVRERLRALGPPHAIAVDSLPGRGTLVRLTIPLTVPDSRTREGDAQ